MPGAVRPGTFGPGLVGLRRPPGTPEPAGRGTPESADGQRLP